MTPEELFNLPDIHVYQPFEQQIEFFKQKTNMPTKRWTDVFASAHDKAFMVAGAQKAELVNDLRLAVEKTMTEGKGIFDFRKEFDSIVKNHGWTGWKGEGSQKGRDWRTRVIYDTNINTSYAAGRWAQLTDPDLLSVRPYWKYVHCDSVKHPRPLHVSWNGLVLKHDDPFWATHFPPNGWFCHCRVTAVRPKDYKGDVAPDDGTYTKTINGVDHVIPNGIDAGFNYAMGANTTQTLTALVNEKLINYPPAISKALRTDLLKVVPPSPLSSALQLPAGTWAQDVAKTVLTAIDDTHSVGILPKTRLKTEATLAFDAAYSIDPSVIGLSTFAPQPELSMLHEIGHLIDNQAIGEIDVFASINHPLLDDWRKAVTGSLATQALSDLHGIVADDRLNYYLATHEQWARSYAQYIAQKTNNTILLRQLAERLNDTNIAASQLQWQDDDFTPIMIAIDNLFVQLGWKNAD